MIKLKQPKKSKTGAGIKHFTNNLLKDKAESEKGNKAMSDLTQKALIIRNLIQDKTNHLDVGGASSDESGLSLSIIGGSFSNVDIEEVLDQDGQEEEDDEEDEDDEDDLNKRKKFKSVELKQPPMQPSIPKTKNCNLAI